jgi:leucine dehydrogenase
MSFDYEQVRVTRGRRCQLPIIVAIHSTLRGPAIGGCRLWRYPDWWDGLADALRLAEGMTAKLASAGLAHGGAKTVVALPMDAALPTGAARGDLMRDVGDVVESFGGSYATGPDVGTSPEDMAVIGEHTRHVFCRPEAVGGSGDCSPYTAAGVLAAIHAVCAELDGQREVRGRRITVLGLGHVGTHLARLLAARGAVLTVTDTDPARRVLADELGATRVSLASAATLAADVLVPAALGGLLTGELAGQLRCRAVVGPANNQLADPGVARLLAARGIRWVPDHLASAGGVLYAVARELHDATRDQAVQQVLNIEHGVTEQLRHVGYHAGVT